MILGKGESRHVESEQSVGNKIQYKGNDNVTLPEFTGFTAAYPDQGVSTVFHIF